MQPGFDEELELPLLSTKISVPLLSQEYVSRPRLVALIDQGIRKPLTLVTAPAGYGKTHLLAEWAQQSSLPTAWLTLSREDNHLVRFFRYFVRALRDVAPGIGEEAFDFIRSTRSSGLEAALTILINEIAALPEDVALILDEFHLIDDPAILHSLNFLIQHMPRHLHLVIAGRGEPALDLPLFRSKGWVMELGIEDLRFSRGEINRLGRQMMGQELSEETVQALEERTGGWVTALQLAAISQRGRSDPDALLAHIQGDAHYLVDFLNEEVLSEQPEEVRLFLLRSSILDILSAPVCEAVVDPDAPPGYGARMLQRLERSNLFLLPVDPKHEWFRYHQLFADFLRHMLETTCPEEIPLLHKRAAVWFEAQNDLDEAFKHALASGDTIWAAGLIERRRIDFLKTGEFESLNRLVEKLPAEALDRHPALALTYSWGLIATYQIDSARYWLDRIDAQLNAAQDVPDPAVLENLQGQLAICRSMLAMISGDIRQAEEYSRQSLALIREDNPFIRSAVSLEKSMQLVLLGDTARAVEALQETIRTALAANHLLVLVLASRELAEMFFLQGHLSRALVTLEKARLMARKSDGSPHPVTGIVEIGIGKVLFERDHLPEAREHLEKGLELARPLWLLSSIEGIQTLARVLQCQGEIEAAQALVEQAARMALSTESSQWDDLLVAAFAARLALQRGDLADAVQWWQRSGVSDTPGFISYSNFPYHVFEFLLLTQARFYIQAGLATGDTGRLEQALEMLETILPQAERFQRLTSKIEILTLQAIADHALGHTDRAEKTLLHALLLAEPENLRRVFVDLCVPISRLLRLCRSAREKTRDFLPTLAFIDSLLAACPSVEAEDTPAELDTAAGVEVRTEDGLLISLSARELEVLKLIAEGKTNKEISLQLNLALNTVKRHAYNIFTKIGVNNRTQAVQRARQLGLLR